MELYLDKVKTMFDYALPLSENEGEGLKYQPIKFSPPPTFKIGLLIGSSGCGKTRLLLSFENYKLLDLYSGWDLEGNKTVIEQIDNDPDKAIDKLLCSGFSSVPQWFLKYSDISEGQKFRAGIAKHLTPNTLNFGIAIDEFTSKLDRLTARNTAYNVNRYVRTKGISNLIIASPFRDIIPYLNPDWIFDVSSETYIDVSTIIPPTISNSNGGYPPKRWSFNIIEKLEFNTVSMVDNSLLCIIRSDMSRWNKYKSYHYLSSNILNNGEYWEVYTKCEEAILPIGYIAITPLPLKNFRAKREHRLVILPEVQGMGIGIALSEFMGQYYLNKGYRYYCKTSHPKLGRYRDAHPEKWRPSTHNGKVAKGNQLSDRLFRKRNGLPGQSSPEGEEIIIDLKTNQNITPDSGSQSSKKVYYCHEFYKEDIIAKIIATKTAVADAFKSYEINPVIPQSLTESILAPTPVVENKVNDEVKPDCKVNPNGEVTPSATIGWKPTTIIGVMTVTHSQVIVRFQQKKTYFKYEDYGNNPETAKSAALAFLEKLNIEHHNPNLYCVTSAGSKVLMLIDGKLLISFPYSNFDKIKDKKLFYRKDTSNRRVYYTSNEEGGGSKKVRMYLDEIFDYDVITDSYSTINTPLPA